MRIARNLTLCALALAAMAVTAPAAPAQGIEFLDEATNEPCDPCVVHFAGQLEIRFMGIPLSSCNDEMEAEIWHQADEAGEHGHIYDYESDTSTSPCTRQNCNGVGEAAGEAEWPLEAAEADPGEEHLIWRFCLDSESNPNAAGLHCTAEYAVDLGELDDHDYRVSATNQPGVTGLCQNGITLTGSWQRETGACPQVHDVAEAVHV
jgi:hypothetical protein